MNRQTTRRHAARRRVLGLFALLATVGALVLGQAVAAGAAPLGPTTVGDYVFDQYDPTNVSAGARILDYVGSATSIAIPDSVTIDSTTYAVTALALNAFFDNGLTAVTIPDTITYIGAAAFLSDHLTTVTIPDSVTDIDNEAFENDALTSVTLGNGLTRIGDGAFASQQLTSVDIPDSVTFISSSAFYGNDLASVTLGDSVATIQGDAFAHNDITQVVLPASVTTHDTLAFDSNPLAKATFLGAVPAGVGAVGANETFEPTTNVTYFWRFGSPHVAGGFTNPTWLGYPTTAIVRASFDTAGHGPAPADQQFAAGGTVTKPADPVSSGSTFTGWFTSPSLTKKFDFTAPLTTDATIYAGFAHLATTGVSINPLVPDAAVALVVLGLGLLLAGDRARRRRRLLRR